jgi:fructose-1,6-bisphosphatase
VHAPHAQNKTTEEIQKLCYLLSDVTDECKQSGREITMGGDFNACVGTRDECNEEEHQALDLTVSTREICAAMWSLTWPWRPTFLK